MNKYSLKAKLKQIEEDKEMRKKIVEDVKKEEKCAFESLKQAQTASIDKIVEESMKELNKAEQEIIELINELAGEDNSTETQELKESVIKATKLFYDHLRIVAQEPQLSSLNEANEKEGKA